MLIVLLMCGFNFKPEAQTIELKNIIQKADSLFQAGNYLHAKAYYQYAFKNDPANQKLADRMNESIIRIRAEKSEREQYSDYMIAADDYIKQNKLEQAASEYQKALELFPYESYPRQQIENIRRELREQEQINREYEEVIKNADELMAAADYENAQIEYQFALSLKAAEDYPKNKLGILKDLIKNEALKIKVYNENIGIADSLFSMQNYQLAENYYQKASELQPNKSYPAEQLKIVKDILNPIIAYNELIEKADNYYLVRDFENAKIYYESAKRLKPEDNYAIEMLNKTGTSIASKATSLQEDYENAIEAGNHHLANKEYQEARQQFEFASRIKPNEQYSREKIDELDAILDSIATMEHANNQYNLIIEKADLFFEARDYDQAKIAYQSADSLKPSSTYTKQKLDEIDRALRLIEDQKELENSYAKSLVKAEALFEQGNFNAAKTEFLYAGSLKPHEPEPAAKVNHIDSILTQIEIQRSAAENYEKTIAEADGFFEQKKYEQAQNSYRKALNYLPDEKYPNERIAEIDKFFTLQQEELDKAYELAISNAQNELAKEQLQSAKTYLNQALALKPGSAYPLETIKQIDAEIAVSKERALAQYEPLLKEADHYFTQKEFDRALSFYTQASALLPNEIYPSTKINEIIQIVKNETTNILVSEPDILENNKLMQYNFEPVPITDRKLNHFLLKLKNSNTTKNLKIILNYGQDNRKNGGMIIRLTESEASQYYLINIGNQYKWFSEDNNWISIQPEGDQVEISEIIIAKLN